jgi:hypothetical protein
LTIGAGDGNTGAGSITTGRSPSPAGSSQVQATPVVLPVAGHPPNYIDIDTEETGLAPRADVAGMVSAASVYPCQEDKLNG